MDKEITDIVVASKIDDYTIVINKGLKDFINSNMRFLVYQEGNEIIDPSTNNSLGKLEIPKGFFKVLHIQDSMTILVSELKKEKSMFQVLNNVYKEIDIEQDLLSKITLGDKVKIVNKL
ncbi:hypothetical protein [Flavobacterium sp. N502540]|uniref:hypothetical protein n=1 Tax=Flavobacterium sp. N502540 TaxID=2986838 RepID=UPI002224B814|nr:hypothetical protein [Flavobacterium sp. N502540]